MEKFEASNGVKVLTLRNGVGFQFPGEVTFSPNGVNAEKVDALREFFQHERDEELGRWRSAQHPDFVAYFNKILGTLTVIWEPQGGSTQFKRGTVPDAPSGGLPADVARAYFEAHPERKDWEDAKPGEIWVLTLEGDEVAYQCTSSFAGHVYFGGADDTIELNSTMITAARRIWPEVSDAD